MLTVLLLLMLLLSVDLPVAAAVPPVTFATHALVVPPDAPAATL